MFKVTLKIQFLIDITCRSLKALIGIINSANYVNFNFKAENNFVNTENTRTLSNF